MSEVYDFIIIGGGPAGSTAGTLLARKGYRVLLLEKEKFPRPHVGESMLSQAYPLFRELGVLDEMKKRFIRKPGVEFSDKHGSESTRWLFKKVIKDQSYLSFHVRRDEFDQMLLENSIKNGAEVIEEAKVTEVDLEDKSGVRVGVNIQKGNLKKVFFSKFLIDATGQGAFLAKLFNSKEIDNEIIGRLAMHAHWVGEICDDSLSNGNLRIVRLGVEEGGWMWIMKIAENKLSVGVILSKQYYETKRLETPQNKKEEWVRSIYQEVVFSSALTTSILQDLNMTSEVTVNADFSYENKTKYGDNFACVGDASAFIDPVFSSGVYLAIMSSFIITEALDDKIKTGNERAVAEAYATIANAYELIKELVRNFYDPKAIKLENLEVAFEGIASLAQQARAFEIFNLLFSGKFFENSQDLVEVARLLRNPKRLSQYRDYIHKKVGASQE